MKLRMPNGYTVFLGNDLTDYEDRLEKVKETILDYNNGQWSEFMNDYWLKEQTIVGSKVNVTKDLLDRVATYLLLWQQDRSNVLTRNQQSKIRQTEIPISSTDGSNIPNLLYGQDTGDENMSYTEYGEETNREHRKDIYNMNEADFYKEKEANKIRRKRYKQTKAYKLNALRSTPEIKTYRLNPVIVNGKVLKDISSNVVLDVEYTTIGGRKGLIMDGEKFVIEWCSVNTENSFEFNGNKYRISDEVEQYTVEDKAVKIGKEYNDFTNSSEMDRILCLWLPEREQVYWFDEEIRAIDGRMILKL